ncbi:hypothetical protein SAMN04488121_102942 [Chitinophaga filiformis]|uniref:Uncharacterized protein n=1 Tax=Chitinophaga filiformis TaxID=104663 RepID=A0A1G7NU73_CHIFI|nr:hypothetical protein SAMN04488121_102942 [Chitinophaga filiformis]
MNIVSAPPVINFTLEFGRFGNDFVCMACFIIANRC